MNFQFNPETGTMEPQDKTVFDMEKKVENDKIVKDKPAPSIPKSNGRDIVRERQKHNLNLNEQILSFKELSDRDIINIHHRWALLIKAITEYIRQYHWTIAINRQLVRKAPLAILREISLLFRLIRIAQVIYSKITEQPQQPTGIRVTMYDDYIMHHVVEEGGDVGILGV